MTEQKNRYSFFILIFVLFAIYLFVFGDSGILERRRLGKDKEELTSRINNLEEENNILQNKYKRYKDGEFYKEEAGKSGYINSGEKLLFFKGGEQEKKKSIVKDDADEKYTVDVAHLRILWIVVSVMFMLIYFVVRSKAKKE